MSGNNIYLIKEKARKIRYTKIYFLIGKYILLNLIEL